MNKLSSDIILFINRAATLGLADRKIKDAQEFFAHHEFGLSYDTIVTGLFEDSIKIGKEFYDLAIKIAVKMKLPEEDYTFIKVLIG